MLSQEVRIQLYYKIMEQMDREAVVLAAASFEYTANLQDTTKRAL
jgi:hypothetical protein